VTTTESLTLLKTIVAATSPWVRIPRPPLRPRKTSSERRRTTVGITAGDQSADLFFGPTAPAGHQDQWIQTNPGADWFVYFRIYGPKQAAFDKTWKPGDFQPQA
jgi:Protein of unknown function (DUF1214)